MLVFITHWIELVGVLLAALASMIIGSVWYSPMMFGKRWMELVGMTPDMAPEAKRQAKTSYIWMGLTALIMAYIEGLFIKNMFVPTLGGAIVVGFFLWLGFVATTMVGEFLFNAKPKPWALYRINVSYQLVNLVIGAIILFFFIL